MEQKEREKGAENEYNGETRAWEKEMTKRSSNNFNK